MDCYMMCLRWHQMTTHYNALSARQWFRRPGFNPRAESY